MEPNIKPQTYSYHITWSPQDQEFVASFIEVPGLSGMGPKVADAIEELTEAWNGWLEEAKEKRFEIPNPIREVPFVVIDRSFMKEDDLLLDLASFLSKELRPEASVENTRGTLTRRVVWKEHSRYLTPE